VDIDPLSTNNYISPTGVNSTVCLKSDTEICISRDKPLSRKPMHYKGTDQFVEAFRFGFKNNHPVCPKRGDGSSKNCGFDMNTIQDLTVEILRRNMQRHACTYVHTHL